MYEYIDEHMPQNKEAIRKALNSLRLLIMKTNDINMNEVREHTIAAFDEINKLGIDFFENLKKHLVGLERALSTYKIEPFLDRYNPTTLYVYANELERKESRYFEALVGLMTMFGTLDTMLLNDLSALTTQNSNLNNLTRQIEETAVSLEREMLLDRFEEEGIEQVEWVAVGDERTCNECAQLNGQIFDIHNVPARPHIGCRCELERIRRP